MFGRTILFALALVAHAGNSQAVLLQIKPRIGDTLRMHLSQSVEMTGTTHDRGRDSTSGMTTSIEVFSRAIAEQWTSGGTLMQTITDSVQMTPASRASLDDLRRRALQGKNVWLRVSPDGAMEVVHDSDPSSELQEILGAQGQRLPLDPPHPERSTVGGMVAANANGLSRARYGTVRDWVIGIAVAYPSGKLARAGGKVVKNVAGYDLMKLHTGALGTLGVVAEVNFKVQASPQSEATVLGHFEAPMPAIDAGARLAHEYLTPAASIVLDREALWSCGLTADWRWTLALKLEGYGREVDAVIA